MNDLPDDLAKPRDPRRVGDIMGIVIGAALFLAVVVGVVVWAVSSHG